MSSYGDFINVSNRCYNRLNGSRLVDHTIKVNTGGNKIPYLNNVLNIAIRKAQIPTIFAKDSVEISTSSRSQYKYIRNVLKAMNANFKVF